MYIVVSAIGLVVWVVRAYKAESDVYVSRVSYLVPTPGHAVFVFFPQQSHWRAKSYNCTWPTVPCLGAPQLQPAGACGLQR